MKNGIYESPQEWWDYFENGAKDFCFGLWDIIVSIVMGIVSLLVYLWKLTAKFIGKYPNFALGGFIVISVTVWVLTFVSLKVRAVGAEAQRDSISYEFSHFKEQHGYEDTTATLVSKHP